METCEISVADQIRQFIHEQHLTPGDRLPTQDQLSVQLGIGLRRLREGLSILEHQGFIESRNKAGTIIRQPSIENLGQPIGWHLDASDVSPEDLVRARACLESGAAAEAAQRRTPRDLLVLLDALETLEHKSLSGEATHDAEQAFHGAILRATHNPVLLTFGQLITAQFDRMRGIQSTPQRRRKFSKEHRKVYAAIERKNSTAARDIMHAHIMANLTG